MKNNMYKKSSKKAIVGVLNSIICGVFVIPIICATTLVGCSKDEPQTPHTHQWVWEIVTEPNCTEDGLKKGTCSCSEEQTETIPAKGHNFVDGECENCGEKQGYTLSFENATIDGQTEKSVKAGDEIELSALQVTNTPQGRVLFGWYDTSDKTKIYGVNDTFVVPEMREGLVLAPVFEDTLAYEKEVSDNIGTGYGKIKECRSVFAGVGCHNESATYDAVVGSCENAEIGFRLNLKGGTADAPQDKIAAGSTIVFQAGEDSRTTRNKKVSFVLENYGNETITLHLRFVKSSGKPRDSYSDSLSVYPDGIVIESGATKTVEFDFNTGHERNQFSIECLTEVSEIKLGFVQKFPHEHIAGESWKISVDNHWKECAVCGEVMQEVAHTANSDNYCSECGYDIEGNGLSYELSADGTYYTLNGVLQLKDEKLTIPETYRNKPVKAIGEGAFALCSELKSVVIPSSVEVISDGAFGYCDNLTEVTFSGSVKIGLQAFYGCSGLEKVKVKDMATWCGMEFANNYSNPLAYADGLYVSDVLVTAFDSEAEKVTELGAYTFSGYSALENINLNGVTSIGNGAFKGCTGLISVTLDSNLTVISNYLFEDCTNLKSVTMSDNVTTIGDNAFNGCRALENIVMSKTLNVIGERAFKGCTSLKEIDIPSAVTSIGVYSFEINSGALTKVNITDLTAWCNIKFEDKSGSVGFEYSNPLAVAKNLYLNGNLITELAIPDGVTAIYDYAFYNSSIVSVEFGKDVRQIGERAFYGCSKLGTVSIPEYVLVIETHAFQRTIYNENLTISCAVEFKPNGWENGWNGDAEVIWVGSHKHEWTWAVQNKPTCTEAGFRTGECACGETTEESIPATGHNFIDGVCEDCGAKGYTLNLDNATYDGKGQILVGANEEIVLSDLQVTNVPEGKVHFGWFDTYDKSKIYAADGKFVVPSGRTDITLAPVFDTEAYFSSKNGVNEGKITKNGNLYTSRVSGCYNLQANQITGAVKDENGNYEKGAIYHFKGGTSSAPTDMAIDSWFLTQEMNGECSKLENVNKVVTTTVQNFGTEDVTLRFALITSSSNPSSQYGEATVTIKAGESVTFTFDVTYVHDSIMTNIMVKDHTVSEIYIGMYQYISDKAN